MFSNVVVKPHKVAEFYANANITPPQVLLEHSSFGKLFEEDRRAGYHAYSESEQLSVLAYWAGTSWQIEDFEKRLDTHSYFRHISGLAPNEGVDLDELKKYLPDLKAELPPKEYGQLLLALVYSKSIENRISVRNDGNVDLRDVSLIVASPLAKTTESREGNILSVDPTIHMLYSIIEHKDRVEVHLPVLKKGYTFQLFLHTRENRITEPDVSCFFEEYITIRGEDLILVALVSFLLMVFVQWFFKGQRKTDTS